MEEGNSFDKNIAWILIVEANDPISMNHSIWKHRNGEYKIQNVQVGDVYNEY